MKRIATVAVLLALATAQNASLGQINTDQVMRIGRNALYFEDYVVAMQYFNQVIAAKPYLAQPYFFRGLAKFNLEDYRGAESDASDAIERNPFITDAYELRGVARQNLGLDSLAITDYQQALTLTPDNRGMLFNLALAHESLGHTDSAETAFENILQRYPGFEGAYLGRARIRLTRADTIGAQSDINKALDINRNSVNAYLMRADLAIKSNADYATALRDMDQAIKLEPRHAGYYINRAYLRYRNDDYIGAMADYDYALQLDPINYVALYNRALLRMEVHDFNHAEQDLSEVLALRPDDYRALYNRAMVRREIGMMRQGIDDVTALIQQMPDFALAYFLRYDMKRVLADRTAQADLDKSIALARKQKRHGASARSLIDVGKLLDQATPVDEEIDSDSPETVARQFATLLTVNTDRGTDQELQNKTIRGRVQDQRHALAIEPEFTLSFHVSPTELKPSGNYLRETLELNQTGVLPAKVHVTNRPDAISDSTEVALHFEALRQYDDYLVTHTPRAIDLFGKGMEHYTLRNYPEAIDDFSKAIALAPDFTLAYFMRSMSHLAHNHTDTQNGSTSKSPQLPLAASGGSLHMALADIDNVLSLNPQMAIGHYNRGVLLTRLNRHQEALSEFDRAIQLEPDFGEAYYNRGYLNMLLGQRTAGLNDLSRAGQLGIVPSYNLIKKLKSRF